MKYRETQLNQKPEAEFINQQIASIELNRGRIEEQFCGWPRENLEQRRPLNDTDGYSRDSLWYKSRDVRQEMKWVTIV